MIDEDFRFANPKDDPRTNKPKQSPDVVKALEAQGFRPFGEEW